MLAVAVLLAVLLQSVPLTAVAQETADTGHHVSHAAMHHGSADHGAEAGEPAKEIASCTGALCCTGATTLVESTDRPTSWTVFAFFAPDSLLPPIPGPSGPERPPRSTA